MSKKDDFQVKFEMAENWKKDLTDELKGTFSVNKLEKAGNDLMNYWDFALQKWLPWDTGTARRSVKKLEFPLNNLFQTFGSKDLQFGLIVNVDYAKLIDEMEKLGKKPNPEHDPQNPAIFTDLVNDTQTNVKILKKSLKGRVES